MIFASILQAYGITNKSRDQNMTTLLILVLLLIISYLLIVGNLNKSKVVAIITLVMFVMIGTGVFSSWLLKELESYPPLSHPNWTKQNAIIVLGGGAVKWPEANSISPTLLAYSRIYEAARLYSSCKETNAECKIIISGGDAQSIGKSEAVVYQDALNAIGIKNTDIIVESNSMNTFKNAEYTSAILRENKFDTVLLVTSGIHMQRALLYFSHFGVKAIPAVSDYIPPRIFLIPLGYNFAITDFVLHEYAGIIRFNLYNYFGLNASVVASGAP